MASSAEDTISTASPASHDEELIDNSDKFTYALSCLFNNSKFSDVLISVGCNTYYAHRILLSSASDVFEIMLMNGNWQESGSKKIQLEESEQCIPVFDSFLKYFYTGKITVTTATVLPILILADKYNAQELRESCSRYMSQHIADGADTNRAITWFQYAKSCNMTDLKDTCCQFIILNMDTVIQSNDWQSLSKENLIEFLQRSDMVVDTELALMGATQRWIECNYGDHIIEHILTDLLPHLRLPMISPDNLQTVEESQFVQKYHSLFTSYFLAAYRHHAVSVIPHNAHSMGVQYQYRNYLSQEYQIQADIIVPGYSRLVAQKGRDKRELTLSIPLNSSIRCLESTVNQKFILCYYPTGYYVNYDSRPRRRNSETKLIIKASTGVVVNTEISVLLYSKTADNTYVYNANTYTHKFVDCSTFEINNLIDLNDIEKGDSPLIVDDKFQFKVVIKPNNCLS